MPIYDYLCTECDHRADILHGINDPGPNFCPSCGKEGTMRKQFAAPAIHYKGSGWAKKDRGGSSAAKTAKPSSDKPDKGEHKHDAKSDAKSGATSSAPQIRTRRWRSAQDLSSASMCGSTPII